MKKSIAVYLVLSTVVVFGTPGFAAIHTFDDFSPLTTDPQLSGYLADAGFEVTFTGDAGALYTDSIIIESWNALFLGDDVADDCITQLTLSFNMPVIELVMEFDAMNLKQQDSVTALIGTWTDFPPSLSLSGQTLSANSYFNPDDPSGYRVFKNLLTTLTFDTPVNSVTFTNIGAFTLDSIAVEAIPEPMTVSLLGLGGLMLLGRRRQNSVF